MTWNGAQGFQTPIQDETFTVKDMGVFGNMHQERNLTCERSLSHIYLRTLEADPSTFLSGFSRRILLQWAHDTP